MPKLSAFTPTGMLKLSGAPSRAEVLYRSLVSALSGKNGGGFDMSQGTRMEVWAYAMAKCLARAAYAVERAGNQRTPLKASDLLPLLERAYLVVPSPGETRPERAATLAAIDALSGGGRFSDLASMLRSLLGSEFLALVPTAALTTGSPATPITPAVWPASPGAAHAPGNWVDARTASLYLQLLDPVTTIDGTTQSWCAYSWLDTSRVVSATWQAGATYAQGFAIVPTVPNGYVYQCTAPGTASATTEPEWPTAIGSTVVDSGVTWTCAATSSPALHLGQTITIQGENDAVAENLVVQGFSLTLPTVSGSQIAPSGAPCFLATFTKPHDMGATIVTGPFPYWASTQRQLIVVVTAAAAANREVRRKIDTYLGRGARGVDTWAIVAGTPSSVVGGTLGGVQVGGPMGTQTVGPFNYTASP